MYDKLASKYGMSMSQAKQSVQRVVDMGKETGLDFNMDSQILTNTFDAHRLTVFSKKHGLMRPMAERLFKAHFTDALHIGDHNTLVNLAVEVGMDREKVREVLKSDAFNDEVQSDKLVASELCIRSVPFFLINKKYTITGAQPSEVFVDAINNSAKEEDINLGTIKKSKTNCSLDDGC